VEGHLTSTVALCRPTCQKQVQGFRGPQFKKFDTREEAEEFIAQRTGGVVDKRKAEVLGDKQDSESSKSNDGESTSKEKPAKKKKSDDGSGTLKNTFVN
jgi:viroplasmin and RNaseH domain-containing protein